ncbi:MAG: hypothetical protein SFU91_12385 [Chloroherpetonaceae bacterium]|nr:hypothetical protein [Chloroherpetonaceae bacterium]
MKEAKVKIGIDASSSSASTALKQLSKDFDVLKTKISSLSMPTTDFNELQNKFQTIHKSLSEISNQSGKTNVSMIDLAASAATVGATITGLLQHYQGLIAISREYEMAARKLEASSKLTGVSFGLLEDTASTAEKRFSLSRKEANELTASISKLASKAGEAAKINELFGRVLDLSAAQGYNAEQAMVALSQAILGIDEGTDKFFQKNPSTIYSEYAAQIKKSAGALTDQEKAQALVNEFMTQGEKVNGQYSLSLQTAAGKQKQFSVEVEKFSAQAGKEFDVTLGRILGVINPLMLAINQAPDSLKTFASSVIILTGSIYALNLALTSLRAAMAASGVGLIPLAIGSAGSAIIALAGSYSKLSSEMEQVERISNLTGKSYDVELARLKEKQPVLADIVEKTRQLADAKERLKKIEDGEAVGSVKEEQKNISDLEAGILKGKDSVDRIRILKESKSSKEKEISEYQQSVNLNKSKLLSDGLSQSEKEELNGKINNANYFISLIARNIQDIDREITSLTPKRKMVSKELLVESTVEPSVLEKIDEEIRELTRKQEKETSPKSSRAIRNRGLLLNAIQKRQKLRQVLGLETPSQKKDSTISIKAAFDTSDFDEQAWIELQLGYDVKEVQERLRNRMQISDAFKRVDKSQASSDYRYSFNRSLQSSSSRLDFSAVTGLRDKELQRADEAKRNEDVETYREALNLAREASQELVNMSDRISQNSEQIKLVFSDIALSFGDSISNELFRTGTIAKMQLGNALGQVASNFGQRLLAELIQRGILKLLTMMVGGPLPVAGGLISALGFSEGGRPPYGRVSIVGEKGPELLVGGSNSRVVSNKNASYELPKILGSLMPQGSSISFDSEPLLDELRSTRKAIQRKSFNAELDGVELNRLLDRRKGLENLR